MVRGLPRRRMPPERAFEPALYGGVLPDGTLALSDSTAYAIKVVGADGRLRRVLRRPIEPRETTRRIERAESERRLKELEEGRGPQIRMMVAGPGGGGAREVGQDQVKAMRRQRIEALVFYPEVPVVQAMAAVWGGKTWVRRRGRDPFDDELDVPRVVVRRLPAALR